LKPTRTERAATRPALGGVVLHIDTLGSQCRILHWRTDMLSLSGRVEHTLPGGWIPVCWNPAGRWPREQQQQGVAELAGG
jgi:hypothetical protein